MPVPTHLRVVFRGVFLTTPETWSFGLKFSRDNTVGTDAGYGDFDLGAMKDAFTNMVQQGDSKWPTNAELSDIRAYIIGTDGLTEGTPLLEECTPDHIHGVTSVKYPNQVCMVITHVASERGPARFGRVFLPTAADMGGNTLVPSGIGNPLREIYTTFVKDCSDAIDLEGTQSSEQLNISKNGSGGTRQAVDHHEIGQVLDTLRSRRRALVENRSAGGHIDW